MGEKGVKKTKLVAVVVVVRVFVLRATEGAVLSALIMVFVSVATNGGRGGVVYSLCCWR